MNWDVRGLRVKTIPLEMRTATAKRGKYWLPNTYLMKATTANPVPVILIGNPVPDPHRKEEAV